MGAPQEYDPGKRDLVFRKIPLFVGGILVGIIVGCEDGSKGPDPLAELYSAEPLKLPPEPQDKTIKIKEVLQRLAGYLYGEIIGMDSRFNYHADIGLPAGEVPRIAVYYVEQGAGRKILLTKDAQNPLIRYHSFSPSPDGRTAALAFTKREKDGRSLNVKIVDIASGKEGILEGSLLVRHDVEPEPRDSRTLSVLQWSHNSRYLSSEELATIWDTRTGKPVFTERERVDPWENVYISREFLWSPKENRVVVFSTKRPFRIIDFDNKENIVLSQFRNSGEVGVEEETIQYNVRGGSTEWSPDGERLAIRRFSWKKDHKIHLVDKRGNLLRNFDFNLPIRNLAWSPDGQHLAFFMDKGLDFWEDYSYEPHLILININSGRQVVIPTIRPPTDTPEFNERVGERGEIFWGEKNTLLMIPPDLRQLPRRRGVPESIPPAKLLFLSVEELLNGAINIRDNKLGSSRIVTLGTGYVMTYKPVINNQLRDHLTIGVAHPERDAQLKQKEPNSELYRVNLNTRQVEFVGKGIGMINRVEPFEEEREIAAEGNIFEIGGVYYLVINGRRYRITTSLEEFQRNRGFEGAVIKISSAAVKDLPEGTIASEPFILDWAGFLRRNNKDGGKKQVFVPGLFTKTGNLDEDISLDRTFPQIRGRLKENGRIEEDFLYMTYDPERKMFGYKRRDTLKEPFKDVTLLSELIREWKEAHPLDKLNLYGHSKGGVVALHAAYQHLDIINNIFTFDAPLRGIPPTLDKDIRRKVLDFFGEELISFLLRAWGDEGYQKRLNNIVREARKRGVGVYTWASKDDLIVPWQSAVLEGATDNINGEPIELAFSMGRTWWNPFDLGHGQVLEHPKILGYVSKIAA